MISNKIKPAVGSCAEADVLIIGGGLAGLRCGISALDEKPDLKVMIAVSGKGPQGSSFTNMNNALGMQVCESETEIRVFAEEVRKLACPGDVFPDLIRVMAEESLECFQFLLKNHLLFDRDVDGHLIRYPGCFSPNYKRAYIFRNIQGVFQILKNIYVSLGGNYCEHLTLIDLIQDKDDSISGALFLSENHDMFAVKSRSLVLATGGTASLFQYQVCGKNISGFSPALVKKVGGKLINMRFQQFVWHDIDSLCYVPVASYLNLGCKIRNRFGDPMLIPEKLFRLMDKRNSHVPVGYHFNDSAIDKFLAGCADQTGCVHLFSPESGWIRITAFAHASNGGALIDRDGRTSVRNLYACGECAGGMHGANRIGGAMILAAQVFGKRSGQTAARECLRFDMVSKKQFLNEVNRVISRISHDPLIFKKDLSLVKAYLHRHALRILSGRSGLKHEFSGITQSMNLSENVLSQLIFKSALIITEPGIF